MPDKKRIFERKIPYTVVRNEVFDEVMPMVSYPAWKVLSAIIRATMGWHKTEDRLSYSQLMERTGIRSPGTLSRAIEELVTGDYIKKQGNSRTGETNTYELNEDYVLILTTTSSVVVGEDTTTSSVEVPLQEMKTQNKGKERDASSDRRRDTRLDHPAIVGYRSLARLHVAIALRDDWIACAEEIGTEKLLGFTKEWIGRGWNKQNVLGIMDYARKGGKDAKRGQRELTEQDRAFIEAAERDTASINA